MKYEQFKEFLGKAHIGDYVSITHRYRTFVGIINEKINFGANEFAYISKLDSVHVRLTTNDPFSEPPKLIGCLIHYPDIIDYKIRNDLKPSNLESKVVSK